MPGVVASEILVPGVLVSEILQLVLRVLVPGMLLLQEVLVSVVLVPSSTREYTRDLLESRKCCELILAWWYVHVSDVPSSPLRFMHYAVFPSIDTFLVYVQ